VEYWKLAKTALVVLKEILVKDHHALKSYDVFKFWKVMLLQMQ
jgi:hypothetical protein